MIKFIFFKKKYSKSRLSWLLFIALAFLALDYFHAIDRFFFLGTEVRENFGLEEHLKRAVFIIWYALAIFILWTVPEIKPIASIPSLFLIYLFTTIDLSLHKIYGFPAQIMNIAVLNGALGNFFDAIKEYRHEILYSFFISSTLFFPLIFRALKKKIYISATIPFSAFFLLALSFGTILTVRGEHSLGSFPKGYSYIFSSISISLNDLYNNNFVTSRIRTPAVINQTQHPKIVFIIDESISYGTFSTLFQEKPASFIDYGIARSAANCSAASNFVLRKAGWKRDSHDTLEIERVQSIFEIAKMAGYYTVFFDNQNVLLEPIVKNFFDKSELQYIDFIYQGDGPIYERDNSQIENLIKELRRERVFIVINKVGAHFPYENTVKPEIRKQDRKEDYLNSIKINSKNYLIDLYDKIDEKTLVFYTSDHGQSFQGKTTHCNLGDNINQDEFMIPFLIFSKNSAFIEKMASTASNYRDTLSHIEISESIRNAMGFELNDYDSIFKKPMNLHKNFCGLYGPPKTFFGTKPRCLRLE